MSYYGNDQSQPWHQHTSNQPANYSTTYQGSQMNGNMQNSQQQRTGPIGPVLNEAVNNIANDLKANIDKDYFKTTCGVLSCIEVIASLIIFIIASNLHTYTFLTLISGFSFWISLLFLLVNMFQIPEKIVTIPWLKVQLAFCGIAASFFLLEAIIMIFFNVILCLLVVHLAALYGYHAYDKLKEYGRIINEIRSQQTNPQQNATLKINLAV